jgi:hypothetical protein
MKKTPQQLANEIIAIFIDNGISTTQQLQILKMVREKIEWCRKTGAEFKQTKLF